MNLLLKCITILLAMCLSGAALLTPPTQAGPKVGAYQGTSGYDKAKLLEYVSVRFNLSKPSSGKLETISGVFECGEADARQGKILGNFDRAKNRLKARVDGLKYSDGKPFPFEVVIDGKYDAKAGALSLDVVVRSIEGQRSIHRVTAKPIGYVDDGGPRVSAKCSPARVEVGKPVIAQLDFVFPSKPQGTATVTIEIKGPQSDGAKSSATFNAEGRGQKKFQIAFAQPGTYEIEITVESTASGKWAGRTQCQVVAGTGAAPSDEFGMVGRETRPSTRDDGHPYQSSVWTSSHDSLIAEVLPKSGAYPYAKVTLDWDSPPTTLKVGQEVKLNITGSMVKSEKEPPKINVSAAYEVSGSVTDLKGSSMFCGFASSGQFVAEGSGEVTFKVAPGGDTIVLVQVVYGLGFSPVTVYTYKRGKKSDYGPIVTRMSVKAID